MTKYAYIDESGTQAEHKIMTVSMVICDGRRVAGRVHARILGGMYRHKGLNLKALSKKQLHFADMSEQHRNSVARQLSRESINAVITSYWHQSDRDAHDVIFAHYTRMTQILIYRVLELTTGKLVIIVAQQGGWENYQQSFITKIKQAAELYSKRNQNVFRKVEYYVKPANTVPGLQLADFYAGAVRKMFLDCLNGLESHLSDPYRQIQHQIALENYIDLEKTKSGVSPPFG